MPFSSFSSSSFTSETAAIQLDKPVDDDLIRRTIERLDFKVVDIKTI